MGVVGKGFQKGKPEEGEALLTVVPFVKEAAIMQRIIGVAFSNMAKLSKSRRIVSDKQNFFLVSR